MLGLAHRQDMSTTDLEPGNTPMEEGYRTQWRGPQGPTSIAQYWVGFQDGSWFWGQEV